ncbi:MAG TPA: hypothetical protein PKA53_01285 [Sphingobacterium sp.]|nr:hypothetical protein [Sphingobacterium sp.]
MRILLLFLMPLWVGYSFGQDKSNAKLFLEKFKNLEGKYFEGRIVAGGREGDGFVDQRLLMQVISYSDREVRVPLYVGEDKSRTWILSYSDHVLTLKHDHRHEDGTPDEVTFYGGTSTNSGSPTSQMFPADHETCRLIDYACQNVWWITMDEDSFTYNLRRIGTDRWFSVKFDLTRAVESDFTPW